MTTGDTRRGLVMEEELAMLAVVRFATQQPPVAARLIVAYLRNWCSVPHT
jgi:hypothetical protein